MSSSPRTVISAKYQALLGALSLAGVLLVLFSTSRYGLGASPDSVIYVSVARSISQGAGLVDFSGAPLITFPPAYSTLLAAASTLLARDPLSAARIVNALLFGALVYLSGLMFARYLAPPHAYALLGAASVLVSVPLVPVAFVAWTEPLFICLVLLFFLSLDSYLSSNALLPLALLSLSAAVACLTRYAGVVLIAVGIIGLLLQPRGNGSVKAWHLAAFVSISTLPLAGWVIRNLLLSGTLFGPRTGSLHTYADNAMASWNVLVSWYVPQRLAGSVPVFLLIAATLVGAAAFRYRQGRQWPGGRLPAWTPLAAFAIIYCAFLIASSETAYTQIIDSRYLSPIYVPLTILLVDLGRTLLLPPLQRLSAARANLLLLGAMVVWLIYPAAATVLAANHQLERGLRFTSKAWRESQTMRYVRDHPGLAKDCPLYSNAYDAIYLLTGIEAKPIPVKSISPTVAQSPSVLRGVWPPEGKACMIQFDEIDTRPYLFTTDEILANVVMQKKIAFDDGAIFFVSRK